MGRHEDSIPPNSSLYPEELQLKLYQAFIFSIPILFSIILFLLFYLFYLKRRANNNLLAQTPTTQHSALHSVSFLATPWSLGIKGELKDKLQVILFDEELRERDTICCVCLGEFELKEELRQLPLCKHVFHGDCIRHWLRNNATCPLCRCPVLSGLKMDCPVGLRQDLTSQENDNNLAPQQEQENVASSTSEVHNSSSRSEVHNSSSRSEVHVIQIVDEPPSSSSSSNHAS